MDENLDVFYSEIIDVNSCSRNKSSWAEVDDTIILCIFAGLNGGHWCCGFGLKRVVGQVLAADGNGTRKDGK